MPVYRLDLVFKSETFESFETDFLHLIEKTSRMYCILKTELIALSDLRGPYHRVMYPLLSLGLNIE